MREPIRTLSFATFSTCIGKSLIGHEQRLVSPIPQRQAAPMNWPTAASSGARAIELTQRLKPDKSPGLPNTSPATTPIRTSTEPGAEINVKG